MEIYSYVTIMWNYSYKYQLIINIVPVSICEQRIQGTTIIYHFYPGLEQPTIIITLYIDKCDGHN